MKKFVLFREGFDDGFSSVEVFDSVAEVNEILSQEPLPMISDAELIYATQADPRILDESITGKIVIVGMQNGAENDLQNGMVEMLGNATQEEVADAMMEIMSENDIGIDDILLFTDTKLVPLVVRVGTKFEETITKQKLGFV